MPVSCCALNCRQRFIKNGIRFHRFPTTEPRKNAWIKAMRRKNWQPSKYARICGLHFITGSPSRDPTHPDYVPSVFPFNDSLKLKDICNMKRRSKKQALAITEWQLEKQMELAVQLTQPQKIEHEIKEEDDELAEEVLSPEIELRELEEPQTHMNHCVDGSTVCPHHISFLEERAKNHQLIRENDSLKMELEDLKRMVSSNMDTVHFVTVKEEPEDAKTKKSLNLVTAISSC